MRAHPTPRQFRWFVIRRAALAVLRGRKPIVVFDRDGTLASVEWVRPSADGKSGWHRYNAGMPFDAVVPYARDLLLSVPSWVGRFMFSGRAQGDKKGEDFRFWQMRAWINKHSLPLDALLMRLAADQRPDDKIKNEFVDLVESLGYEIIAAVDDRPQVCDLVWRARGVPLVQVVDPGIEPLVMG